MQNSLADPTHQEQTIQMLRALNFPVYRIGYRQLCIGIPLFHRDEAQSLSKQFYPCIASQWGISPSAVEHSIRDAIHAAWEFRDEAVWAAYFPKYDRAPSNKQFIATLSEHLP